MSRNPVLTAFLGPLTSKTVTVLRVNGLQPFTRSNDRHLNNKQQASKAERFSTLGRLTYRQSGDYADNVAL